MAYALHQDGKRIAAFDDAEQLVRYLLHNPQILRPGFVILPATVARIPHKNKVS